MPEGAKPGDVLLLTKALGTQVRLTKKKVGVSGQKTTFYLRLPSHLRPPLVRMPAWKSMLSSLKASSQVAVNAHQWLEEEGERWQKVKVD